MGQTAGHATGGGLRGVWRRLRSHVTVYLGSTGSLMVGSASQLLTFAILARSLGVEQFGTYTVMVAVTNITMQVCGFGGSETLVRRVALDPAVYGWALGHNLILIAATGAPLVLGLWIAMPVFLHPSADPVTNGIVLAVFALTNVVLVRLILLTEQIFIAFLRLGTANLVNLFYAVGRTATVAVACLVFKVDRVDRFVFWLFGGHVLVALGCLATLWHLGRPRWALMRDEVKLGFYFFTPYCFQALRQSAEIMVLHVVAPAAVVGAYSMARRIFDTSAITATALYRMTYPRLAKAAEQGLRAAWPMVLDVLKIGLVIALVTAVGTYGAASAMPWLFGREFGQMVWFLHVMCWALIPVTIHTVAAEALGSSRNHWARAALYNAGSLCGAGIATALTRFFAIDGTLAALYFVEVGLALAFWLTLMALVRREKRSFRSSGRRPAFR